MEDFFVDKKNNIVPVGLKHDKGPDIDSMLWKPIKKFKKDLKYKPKELTQSELTIKRENEIQNDKEELLHLIG